MIDLDAIISQCDAIFDILRGDAKGTDTMTIEDKIRVSTVIGLIFTSTAVAFGKDPHEFLDVTLHSLSKLEDPSKGN